MGYAHQIVADYFRRRNVPPDSSLDGLYQYEITILRDMLDRLEVILGDEGVPQATGERVIRCMLYGSPSPAAAEERMRRDAEMVKLLSERPPIPFALDVADRIAGEIGLPLKP